jgi:hypothetical protein
MFHRGPVAAWLEEEKWSMGISLRASLALGQRCGGWAMVWKWRRRRNSMAAALEL